MWTTWERRKENRIGSGKGVHPEKNEGGKHNR